MKIRTWLGIGALAASVAAAWGLLLKRRRKDSGQTEPAQLPANQGPDLASVISEGIRRNAPVFDGLYEGLFQAARNTEQFATDAYEEWCDRAAHTEDEAFRDAFAEVFSKSDIADEALCRRKYGSLLACIDRAGIIRERESGLAYTADEAMCRAYLAIGGAMEPGAEYVVLKSAWTRDGKVVEYGMAMSRPAE